MLYLFFKKKCVGFIVVIIMFLTSGCSMHHANSMVPHSCPIPEGFDLNRALIVARSTLTVCPNKVDAVFKALLKVAKHSPALENKTLIINLFKSLSQANIISQRYSKNICRKYFSSTKFVSIPSELRVGQLKSRIDGIKADMRSELRLKRIGLVECCDDEDKFARAEAECAKVIGLLDALYMNEEFLNGGTNDWM